ncbi:MAG: TIGR00297 family protein [Synechococcus sp.]|nr:TIGR00297 family protein [Synechococcus sp.]
MASAWTPWALAIVLNGVLIACAHRLPLLTSSGWVHAGVLGTVLWGCLGWRGWLTVVLYLALGSLVTKVGFQRKQALGLAEARGGRRSPANVWGSAAVGACLALLIGSGLEPRALLIAGFAASFAAKLGDTFGSELGKRYGRTTVLITTLRRVPPGTEGAVSVEGTLASFAGSGLMMLVMVAVGLLPTGPVAWLVACVGFVATLLESVLGALAQERTPWLSNELVNGLQTAVAALLAMGLCLQLQLLP